MGLALVGLLLAALAVPSPAPETEKPTLVFGAEVAVVAVDVAVLDGDGRPVRGLAREDFTLSVDGSPREVASADYVSFASDDEPPAPPPPPDAAFSTNEGVRRGRTILVVVDEGNLRPFAARHLLKSADGLLDRLLPGDMVGLVTLPGGGPQVELTTDHAAVRAALTKVTGRASFGGSRLGIADAVAVADGHMADSEAVYQRECPVDMGSSGGAGMASDTARLTCLQMVEGEAIQVAQTFRTQSEAALRGLSAVFEVLRGVEGSKTVVFLTAGLQVPDASARLEAMGRAAALARVTFYTVHVEGTAGYDASRMQPHASAELDSALLTSDLTRLSSLTRGSLFRSATGGELFTRIAREISGHYVLGFEPRGNDRDGATHEIAVKVTRPGVTVRARRALLASASAVPPAQAVAELLRSPLVATDLPLRVTAYSVRGDAPGKVRVLVAGELGRAEKRPRGVTLGYVLLDAEGKVAAGRAQRLPDGDPEGAFLVDLPVTPGPYALKVAAVDAVGRGGSVERRLTAGLHAAGEVEVTDLLLAPSPDKQGSTLRPTVDPTAQAGSLTAYLELLGRDAGRLKAAGVSFEVAAEEGGPALLTAPAILSAPAKDHRSAQAAIPVSLLPPGRYLARASVSLGGKTAGQVSRAFTVPATAAGPTPQAVMAGFYPAAIRFDASEVLSPEMLAPALDGLRGPRAGELPASAAGAAEAIRAGRFAAAAEALSGPERESPALAFLRGLAFLGAGNAASAATQLRAAVKGRSDLPGAVLYLGAALAALGADHDAVGAWTLVLGEEGGRSPVPYLLLADASMRLGRPEEAVELLREGIVAWPGNEPLLAHLGLAYAMAGKTAEALPLLEAHLERVPDDLDALFAVLRLTFHEVRSGATLDEGARERFRERARRYAKAGGPLAELVGQWQRAVGNAAGGS